jgi:hypothetical protein
MEGIFPTVTQAEEKRLRKAGFAPVLRWVRFGPNTTDRALKTDEALRIARAMENLVVVRRKPGPEAKTGGGE